MSARATIGFARIALLCGALGSLGGCITDTILVEPAPYNVLSVDETMTCPAIASSFRFSAARAARLEYWLSVGPLAGYGYERFPLDAPIQLVDERRRLDALSDLQRTKGCTVMEPGPAVLSERARLEGSIPRPPVVLNSKG